MSRQNGNGMSWVEAREFSQNLDASGYSDWRLPSKKELADVVGYASTKKDQALVYLKIEQDQIWAADQDASKAFVAYFDMESLSPCYTMKHGTLLAGVIVVRGPVRDSVQTDD